MRATLINTIPEFCGIILAIELPYVSMARKKLKNLNFIAYVSIMKKSLSDNGHIQRINGIQINA